MITYNLFFEQLKQLWQNMDVEIDFAKLAKIRDFLNLNNI